MKKGLLVAMLVGVLGGAPATSIGETALQRSGVENPDGTGWNVAESEKGGFKVLLPCRFNESSTRGDGALMLSEATYTVWCSIEGRAKFSANKLVYGAGTSASVVFERIRGARDSRGSSKELLPSPYGNYRALELEDSRGRFKGISRLVLVNDGLVLMDVEWLPSAEELARPRVAKFFGSFDVWSCAEPCSRKAPRAQPESGYLHVRQSFKGPTEGAEHFRYKALNSYSNAGSAQDLYLDRMVLLDSASIKSVSVVGSRSDVYFGVKILLTDAGSLKLNEFARQHRFKSLAIVLNGEIVYDATLVSPDYNGVLTLTGPWSEIDANELAHKLNATLRSSPNEPLDGADGRKGNAESER